MEALLSGSTIFAQSKGINSLSGYASIIRWGFIGASLALLSACGPNQVIVEGDFPTPLMSPLPLTIGVWYDEEFSTHEFFDEAKGRSDSSWVVKTGQAQIQMWDIVLGGMFEELVHMKGAPSEGQLNQVVDAVLIPHVDELQYAIPAHTNIKVYEIWMRYRIDMVTSSGEPIGSWTMTSYGKTPTAFLRSDKAAVNLAAVVALRDAGANFISNFSRVPEVRAWQERRSRPRPTTNDTVQSALDATDQSAIE
ncbi:MAG: hypothetical protein ACJAYC_003318 [Halieaceae bacterium]|jgi:hypothetical protein